MEKTDAQIERYSRLLNEARREAMVRTLAAKAQAAALQPEPQYVEPFGLMRLPDGVMVVYRAQVYASPATKLRAHSVYASISNTERGDEAV